MAKTGKHWTRDPDDNEHGQHGTYNTKADKKKGGSVYFEGTIKDGPLSRLADKVKRKR